MIKSWRIGNRWTDVFGLLTLVLLSARGMGEILFSDYARRATPGLSRQALGHYEFIKHHLRQPFHGYKPRQVLFDGFSIIALSHMACGFVNMTRLDPSLQAEVLPLIEETYRRAVSPFVAPFPKFTVRPKYWKKEALYLSHLNQILGAYRLAGGDGRFDELHSQISKHLSEAIIKEPDFTLESYGGGDKWPADQSATLCSLYVYDKTHGTSLAQQPITGWLRFMKEKATDPKTGLHDSYLSKVWVQKRPRGCALSWTTLYMAQFAPREATDLYQRYRSLYLKRFGPFGGFREWPPRENYGMSADTGPILFDMGMAASGLGIGPARLFHDEEAYRRIMRSGALIGFPWQWRGRRWYLLAPLLGEAILFNGETATPWFSKTGDLI